MGMGIVHAIFGDGVFRPIDPVDLPERCQVVFEPKVVGEPGPVRDRLDRVYEILGRRYRWGQTDTAERHNEHRL
jgi:predicted DNA-binding antitoxin AbrB/MazE fold protein